MLPNGNIVAPVGAEHQMLQVVIEISRGKLGHRDEDSGE